MSAFIFVLALIMNRVCLITDIIKYYLAHDSETIKSTSPEMLETERILQAKSYGKNCTIMTLVH